MEGASDKEKMNLYKQGKVVVLYPTQWLVIGNTMTFCLFNNSRNALSFSNDLNPSHANLPQ